MWEVSAVRPTGVVHWWSWQPFVTAMGLQWSGTLCLDVMRCVQPFHKALRCLNAAEHAGPSVAPMARCSPGDPMQSTLGRTKLHFLFPAPVSSWELSQTCRISCRFWDEVAAACSSAAIKEFKLQPCFLLPYETSHLVVDGIPCSWQLVVSGQHWGQPCVISLLVIWMRGLNAPPVGLQLALSWQKALICLVL